MLSKEIISKQFDYNRWANDKILEKAAQLSHEQLLAPTAVEGRSLYQILFHMVRVEKVWRLLSQVGTIEPGQLPEEEDLPGLDDILAFNREEDRAAADFLAAASAEELAEPVIITRWDGVEVSMIRWQMLAHRLLHSMQHRSEAAVVLTQYDQSPGDLDFLFFVI